MSVFVDVQPARELGRRRADRRGVRSREPEHAREQDDHARPLLAAEQPREAALERACRGRHEHERVLGDALALALPAHAGIIASGAQTSRRRRRTAAIDDRDGAVARRSRARLRAASACAGPWSSAKICRPPRSAGTWLIALSPARRQEVHERREDEEDPDERRDSAGRVADDRAEREREHADERHVDARRRSRSARCPCASETTSCEDVVPTGSPGSRRSSTSTPGPEPERDDGGVDELRPEHRQPLRHRGERRADRAGRVLRGDR